MIAVSVGVIITACEKENSTSVTIEGAYYGTLSRNVIPENTAKKIVPVDTVEASAEVSAVGESLIEIHCYGGDFDTTFNINYYTHHDSVYVCFTAEQFEHKYGHILGSGHMGGMMGDMMNDETEWMHHLDDEHSEGDEHFGGFNMEQHSFGYTFSTDDGTMLFQGTKQQ